MLVIIHGWSDNSKSFTKLADYIGELPGHGEVHQLFLGDYVSMDDEVTFDDVREAMERAWHDKGLPTAPRSVDIVVHSTGALVVRYWMTCFYAADNNPVRRFLMLAPANFGSPLAHKGHSFVGRVVKGFSSPKRFQTGTHILKGLELASPFSFELAKLDRFGNETWYGPNRILATVIVGTEGYTGISAAANEVGSDGTVRQSTANLNPVKLEMDFATDPQHPTFQLDQPKGRTAFFRVDGLNHSTAALKGRDVSASDELRKLIASALAVDDDDFEAFCDRSDQYSSDLRKRQEEKKYTQAYQNTVVHLCDNLQHNVEDYFIEVFAKRNSNDTASAVDNKLTKEIQEEVLQTVHAFSDDASYRSLYFNVTEMNKRLVEKGRDLYIAITAMPDLSKNKVVGYKTLGYNDIGSIRLTQKEIQRLFAPDRTVLVNFRIRREQSEQVFVLRSYP